MIMKIKNIILKIKNAKPLKPLNPKIAAISAIIKEIIPINKNILIKRPLL